MIIRSFISSELKIKGILSFSLTSISFLFKLLKSFFTSHTCTHTFNIIYIYFNISNITYILIILHIQIIFYHACYQKCQVIIKIWFLVLKKKSHETKKYHLLALLSDFSNSIIFYDIFSSFVKFVRHDLAGSLSIISCIIIIWLIILLFSFVPHDIFRGNFHFFFSSVTALQGFSVCLSRTLNF